MLLLPAPDVAAPPNMLPAAGVPGVVLVLPNRLEPPVGVLPAPKSGLFGCCPAMVVSVPSEKIRLFTPNGLVASSSCSARSTSRRALASEVSSGGLRG